jgi:ABC-type phosphate transport system substrate-binding protein
MRMLNKLIAGGAVLAAVTALAAGPALADPPPGKTPAPSSVVSAGSNTTQYLSDALSAAWDSKNPKKTQLYSWDALDPEGTDNNIAFKSGCTKVLRPNGSSPAVAELAADAGGTTKGHPCLDFARSSRAPKATDPTDLSFIGLGLDNVTYASLASGSNAPKNLTTAQLHNIYTCSVTNWDQVGGKNAPIKPLLAQSGSGTVSFFLAAIDVTTPGPCVSEPATLEENEGVNPVFKGNKDEIIPFSAGLWAAQEYHSAKCLNTSCTLQGGVICKPKGSDNKYGCDLNGVLGLNDINGTAPVKNKALNPPATSVKGGFTNTFVRNLYDVVRGTKKIPTYLTQFLGPKGWFCTNPTIFKDYGFEPSVKGFASCGSITAG